MSKVALIVFSKDRAMQLDALLQTIEKYGKDFFRTNVRIIYKATALRFRAGYELVRQDHPHAEFLEEIDLKADILSSMSDDYICMNSDDDLYCNPLPDPAVIEKALISDTACFSLRLGLNIDYCHTMDSPIEMPRYEECGGFIKWNWAEGKYDFGYPLSIVGHVFRTSFIKELTESIEFRNPNFYEERLQTCSGKIPPKMASMILSCNYGVPVNLTNDSHKNRNGITHSYGLKELNDRLLGGERIDITNIPTVVRAAQTEIEYVFRKA